MRPTSRSVLCRGFWRVRVIVTLSYCWKAWILSPAAWLRPLIRLLSLDPTSCVQRSARASFSVVLAVALMGGIAAPSAFAAVTVSSASARFAMIAEAIQAADADLAVAGHDAVISSSSATAVQVVDLATGVAPAATARVSRGVPADRFSSSSTTNAWSSMELADGAVIRWRLELMDKT